MQQKSRTTLLMLTGCLCLLLVIMAVGCSNQAEATKGTKDTTDKTVAPGAVVSVEEAVRSAEAGTPEFSVEGVVLTATAEDDLLTMIGLEAYKSCGLSDCCLYLPVRWAGDMPTKEEVVVVTGAIEATDSGMIFVARELRQAELTDSL